MFVVAIDTQQQQQQQQLILVLIFFSKATTHKQFIHKEFIPNTKP
jgi:hypothetical protein